MQPADAWYFAVFPIRLRNQMLADMFRPGDNQRVIGVQVCRAFQPVRDAAARDLMPHALQHVTKANLQRPCAGDIFRVENSQLQEITSTGNSLPRVISATCFSCSALAASASVNCRSTVGLLNAVFTASAFFCM